MTTENQKSASPWYYTVGRVLLFYVCSVATLILSSALTKKLSTVTANLLSILFATVVTLLLVILFARWQKLTLNNTGILPGKKSLPRFLAGYTLGLLMAVAQALTVLSFGHLQLTLVSNISLLEIVTTLLLYLLVACREELAFRSYALRSLDNSIGPVLALLIITTIFIAEHVAAGTPWLTAIIGIGAGGFLFGMAALKTRGLALPLGIHAAWNFGQWSLGFKGNPGIWRAVVEKGYERTAENIGLAAFAFVTALAIVDISIFIKRPAVNKL